MQAVCRLAKVSTRSFYELYADHQKLLESLYIDLNSEVLDAIADGNDELAPDVFTAVRTLVGAALGPMLHDERKARVMEIEVVGVSEALERERRLTFRRLATAVDGAFDLFAAAGHSMAAPCSRRAAVRIMEAWTQLVRSQTWPHCGRPSHCWT
ncbi:hypothetical protein CVV68_09670 [Arthrobacter livingstonensis]|uniref:HTH tetR-type domain-containing protein n=1 Tax=Arthrobacter livingstonensis TaxID=670078 RepID=A0A2V5LVR8_9MICC|nr:hypothetical protein CVV68_09670 [Arthrobacter livingstonensis]